jgi:hypothetical protein
MNDEDIENLILSGKAIPAELWIKEDYSRRIGESVFDADHAKRYILSRKNRGVELWIHDVKTDENGLLYASALIYKLPNQKSRKKNVIKSLNLGQLMIGLPAIEFNDQKYVYSTRPSAKQVEQGISNMKSAWGGFSSKEAPPSH